MNSLNPREKQRQKLLRQIIRSIIEFETRLVNNRHSRECVYHIFLSVYHQRICSKHGVIFTEGHEQRADEFFQTNVWQALAEFAGNDREELEALEGEMLAYFANVIRQIRSNNLRRNDIDRQRAAAATN